MEHFLINYIETRHKKKVSYIKDFNINGNICEVKIQNATNTIEKIKINIWDAVVFVDKKNKIQ